MSQNAVQFCFSPLGVGSAKMNPCLTKDPSPSPSHRATWFNSPYRFKERKILLVGLHESYVSYRIEPPMGVVWAQLALLSQSASGHAPLTMSLHALLV